MHTIDTNILLRAPTQYTGVSFNSYANFNGVKLAASADGIYEVCCGNSDDGVDIDSHFAVVKTNFGDSRKKQLRYVHIGFKSKADLFLEVSCDDKDAVRYTVETPIEGQQYRRVTIGSQLKGYWFYFRLRNANGNYFAVDDMLAEFYILTGGRK